MNINIAPTRFNTYKNNNTNFKSFRMSELSSQLCNPTGRMHCVIDNIDRTGRFQTEFARLLENLPKLPDINVYTRPRKEDIKNFKQDNKIFGRKVVDKMVEEISNAREKYGIPYDFSKMKSKFFMVTGCLHIYPTLFSNQELVFDYKTGELLRYKDDNKTIYDIKNGQIINTIASDRMGNINPFKVMNNSSPLDGFVRQVTDLEGNLLNITVAKKHWNAEYEITEYDSKGNMRKVGLAGVNCDNHNKHIEKNFVSPDGTKTDYVYADDKLGNRFLYYKITDKDGNVLSEIKEKFKCIDDNHFISTSNGMSYDIQFTEDNVVVTKLDEQNNMTDNKVVYHIKEYSDDYYKRCGTVFDDWEKSKLNVSPVEIYKENNLMDSHTVDKNLLPILKQLSGQEWFLLDKAGTEFIRNICIEDADWAAHSISGGIEIRQKNEDFSILEHEIGHEVLDNLKFNLELRRIVDEEARLFESDLPKSETCQMEYLLQKNPSGVWITGYGEIVAEANKIIHTPNLLFDYNGREQYLMKYFPKTIAYVANERQRIISDKINMSNAQ